MSEQKITTREAVAIAAAVALANNDTLAFEVLEHLGGFLEFENLPAIKAMRAAGSRALVAEHALFVTAAEAGLIPVVKVAP